MYVGTMVLLVPDSMIRVSAFHFLYTITRLLEAFQAETEINSECGEHKQPHVLRMNVIVTLESFEDLLYSL